MNLHIYTIFLLVQQLVSAQFEFNPGTYGSSELYVLISGYYNSYASIWEGQLTSAKASLPGAYMQLTSIFNTDSIPATFDPAFVSQLAKEMVEIGHTTIVDPNVNPSTLQFSPTTAVETVGTLTVSRTVTSKTSTTVTQDETADQSSTSPKPTATLTSTVTKTSETNVFTLITSSDQVSDSHTSAAQPSFKCSVFTVMTAVVSLLLALA